MAAATSSLPVPDSPEMSTRASDGATRAIISRTRRRAGLEPIISPTSPRSARRARASPRTCRSPTADARASRTPPARGGLLEEVECPALRGANGVAEPGPTAHHDDRYFWCTLAKCGEHGHAIHLARHHEVDERDVRLRLHGERDTAGAVGRLANLIAFRREQGTDHAPDVRLVVDDEDRWHSAGSLGCAVPRSRGMG